jgi:hypothetical protein
MGPKRLTFEHILHREGTMGRLALRIKYEASLLLCPKFN